jgi:hemerythrin
MAHLRWSRELDTGVEIIDEQHKRIVQYINELYDAQMANNKEKVGEIIEELVDYTVSHFAFEESLMEQANYPFLSPHKKVHGLFINRVSKFVERFEAGEDVAGELLSMLQKWLVNHIRNEDGDYGPMVAASMKKLKSEGGWLGRSLKKFFG